MRHTIVLLTVTAPALVAALAACSTATSSGAVQGGQAATQAASPAAATSTAATSAPASTAAASSPSASGSGAPTTLDPCQVVTAAEASALAGVTFGAGKEEPSGTDGKRCVYGAQTTTIFSVIVGQAASASDADAMWSTEESAAQAAIEKQAPAGMSITEHTQDVSGLADRAAVATGSASGAGVTLGASAIYLLKGATFVSYSDIAVGHPVATAAALEAEAPKALARV
jgi:hypothetical protein